MAERTRVYDITELMGDSAEAIRSYSTTIDLEWLGSRPLPSPARRSLLVSADMDLAVADVPLLRHVSPALRIVSLLRRDMDLAVPGGDKFAA